MLRLALLLTSISANAQQQNESQQPPAPIVRIRPRPQTSTPTTVPPDAAPLANRPVRPRPVNPQSLSGAPGPSGQTGTTPSTTRPHPTAQTSPTTAQPAHTAATGSTGQTGVPRLASRPSTTPASATPQVSTTSEHPTQPKPPALSNTLNRNVIVLDPAHGAQDSGSRIGDNLLEKDVDLAFAFRLRSLLTARGFTVVLTRDSDAATQQTTPSSAPTPLTLDDRAGIANHSRPAACLLVHATGRGNGVHLYTSELEPAPGEASLLPWLTAQAAWVPASQQLEHSVSSALGRSHIALVSSTASIRPVDSLACPALVLELAPEGSDPRSITDNAYQDRVASAVAGALIFWQNQVQTPLKLTSTPLAPHTPTHRHIPAAPKAPATPTEAQP